MPTTSCGGYAAVNHRRVLPPTKEGKDLEFRNARAKNRDDMIETGDNGIGFRILCHVITPTIDC
jgi:hypothetical protein